MQLIFFEREKIIPEPTERSRPSFKAREGAINFFRDGKNYSGANVTTHGLKAPEGAINFFRDGKNYSGANGASYTRFEGSEKCNYFLSGRKKLFRCQRSLQETV